MKNNLEDADDLQSYSEKVAAEKCGFSRHTFKKWRQEGKAFPDMPVFFKTPGQRGSIRYRHFQIMRFIQYHEMNQ
jgi:hypothetical protein|tara:strand:- start:611 stop:835 length:225 start_codon:yes stop_codon:yes gene_type:complete